MKKEQKQDGIEVAEPGIGADVEMLEFYEVSRRFDSIDGYESTIEKTLFDQCATVARLAVEVGRLKVAQGEGKVNPSDSLREAADLILASAEFIAVNPKRQQAIAREAFFKDVDPTYSMNSIRGQQAKGINVRMKDDKLFYFPPFLGESDRGFEEFVEKHFFRLISEELDRQSGPQDQQYCLRSELEKNLASEEDGLAKAVDFMRDGYYAIRASLLKLAAMEEGEDKGAAWASAVVNRWAKLAAIEASEESIRDWRENKIPFRDLRLMAETRQMGNKNKGRGKRRKDGEMEGTTNEEPNEVKKQAGGRKKQA